MRIRRIGAAVGAGLLAVLTSACQGATTPAQVSLWHPAQLFPEESEVNGGRLNLIYGRNKSLTGMDIGLFNRSEENMTGGAAGLLHGVGGDLSGVQLGILGNLVGGKASGVQVAFVNAGEEVSGAQLGIGNLARANATGVQLAGMNVVQGDARAFQLGLISNFTEGDARWVQTALWANFAKSITGVQLGALNMVSREEDDAGVKGLQLGLVNVSGKLEGVQFGLLNCSDAPPLRCFPLIKLGL